MLVGIHQPHYLPWLRYFEKIARSDVFVALDNIQFSKNGWQNRNKVKTATGTTVLTVPVATGLGDTLDQVGITPGAPWRRKHWRTIEQAYGKAPHFDAYAPTLAGVYERNWDSLNGLNRHMLDCFVKWLGIDTPIVYASDLNVPGTATERLVNLVKAVDGDTYYTGAFALDEYLDETLFEKAGIALRVQEWHAPVYPQLHGEFVPDLSILDLLMNCGPESLDIIMRELS
jgi:WbqC-like protein family